jgi:phosphotriesterase-related protein
VRVVRTVRGDVPVEHIGHTQTHEHVLSNLAATTAQQGRPLARAEEIRLDNYYEIRRHHSAFDLVMDDVDDAISELMAYAEHGGSAVVDATSLGLGRNPEGLREVSVATGVHIVMGSGYYLRDYHPSWLDERSRQRLAEEIHRDVVEGVGEPKIKSGVIGEIGLGWPVHPVERRVLEAAADAQRSTGAALLIHPGRHPSAPLDAMRIVAAAGGDTSRVIMSHIDRTLFDLDSMLRLADTGCYLEFDLFGQESSYYSLAEIDMPNDATRVEHLLALTARGFGQRLLVAQDICSKTHLRKYGGEGYGHLIRNVLPLMRRKGMTPDNVRDLTVDNPREALAIPV